MTTTSIGLSHYSPPHTKNKTTKQMRIDHDRSSHTSHDSWHEWNESSVMATPGVPEISEKDIEIGPLLGEGSFSTVHRIVLCSPDGKRKVHAIKYLRDSIITDDSPSSKAAVTDLQRESKMLTRFQHEHIIKLHGVGYLPEDEHRYFLVLDRLTCTLDDKVQQWRLEQGMVRTSRQSLCKVQKERLHNRIQNTLLPIAKALQYLHSKDVLFRDLKPSNIGYDANGTAKLFDFGLACDIACIKKARVGSPRFMSPEIMQKLGYDTSTDVYSFSLLQWQVSTLEQPFANITSQDRLHDCVVHENLRPTVDYKCGSQRLQDLMVRGWDKRPELRPDMTEIIEVLKAETSTKNVASKLIKKISTKQRSVGTVSPARTKQRSAGSKSPARAA